MNTAPSMLPLTSAILAEQANRYVLLQGALRAAAAIVLAHQELRDQSIQLANWLQGRIDASLGALRSMPWWQEPADASTPAALIPTLENLAERLPAAPISEVLLITALDGAVSLKLYFDALADDAAKAVGTVEDHLRMIAENMAVAEVPVPDLLWPKNTYRPPEADGRIASVEDGALPAAIRAAAESATHVLLAPHQHAAHPLAQQGRVACELQSIDPEHIYRVGQLCANLDTLQLLGLHQKHQDERTTIANLFAAIVQQQQHLMMTLEGQGFRLDMKAPNPVPPSCNPSQAFAFGAHEVFLRELRAISAAKEANRLVSHAIGMYDRLSANIESILAEDPAIPAPAAGAWVPSRKDIRNADNTAAHVLAFASAPDGSFRPVIYQLPTKPVVQPGSFAI